MSSSRLSLAVESGQISLPAEGRIAVFAPSAGMNLSALPRERVQVITSLKPDYDAFSAAGYDVALAPEGDYSAALVFVTRAKAEARALVAQASELADIVFIDGQKNDGVDSMLKDCKKRVGLNGSFSKAHGKLFWFEGGDFSDWKEAGPSEVAAGFVTRPGVFSADGIDPASAALVAALPDKLGRQVADLGAGWGYLSKAVLERADVEDLYLVEANHVALDCAQQNITDSRASFHWADAITWEPRARMNTVVMNPPFHSGRAANPALGKSFIAAAARMLAPSGQLWMVANRHLPYEATLEGLFGKVEEITGDNRFKILRAERPSRAKG
ncbi:Ribosomal RNA large subunit methyltransferase G [Cognatishimia activa]|uniref:Ribosomal RNA large subunit methyltransferase G n=1 Tax=Cognatishimia activa TaxID=1715691 RepID=A0A0P1IY46_9RHOB|nr:class I SAM-dependent methyltransferase [Cognatishimia activa]CUK26038.1 Ribosomal RNA large subunit methyltransferase G [Cognatishimia activa]